MRLLRALWHVLVGLLTIVFLFPRLAQDNRDMRIQVWSAQMLGLLDIKLVVHGKPPSNGPVLLVANHISWLDITSLHAACFCRFVSKADVKAWPVIGTLASGVGTLFIQRESRRDAMRVVHHMAERLRAGDVLAVFPEGTTSDGQALLPFHANLLQAAIASDVPVMPLGLSFLNAQTGRISLAPAYVGEDTLWESVWRTLRAKRLIVVVSYGEPQRALGRDRRRWAEDLQNAVKQLRQTPV
jgi:1-acyl-sn-glycerol-3-phosphate acyltransferase